MKRSEIQPLKTLDQVLDWKPEQKFQIEKLEPRIRDSSRPRLLVCHDMQGGYLEDRFVDGSDHCDGYRIFHWNYVDTFVYFSHHFVTIPPIGWINVAHKHGVKVLGTIITEWDQGKEICESLLGCEEKLSRFIDNLVAICKHFGFDGWLVNIENELKENMVTRMVSFLKQLKLALGECVPGSQVIWYDSIITSGQLKWQNELNDLNKIFFDVSDGIFLNYNWTEDQLKSSLSLAGSTRTRDIYVGVDVFGRGCLGGGGFNTSQAVEVATRVGLSVALFAPGWVLEVHGWDNFIQNQYKFWNLIGKFFRSSAHCSLPIITSFCQGCGTKLFKNGQCINNSSWYNLSAQQLQPSLEAEQESKRCHALVCSQDGFSGGGCLEIIGTLTPLLPCQNLKLLDTYIEAGEQPWLVCLTWKPLPGREVDVDMILTFKNLQENLDIVLSCSSVQQPQGQKNNRFLSALTPGQAEKRGLNLCFEHCNSWVTRSFLLEKYDFVNHIMTGISIRVSCQSLSKNDKPVPVDLLLGELQVRTVPTSTKTANVLPQNTDF